VLKLTTDSFDSTKVIEICPIGESRGRVIGVGELIEYRFTILIPDEFKIDNVVVKPKVFIKMIKYLGDRWINVSDVYAKQLMVPSSRYKDCTSMLVDKVE
jgi:hypothetical protein